MSKRKFSESVLTTAYQAMASAPITHVEIAGVRKRGWIRPSTAGIAPERAIERTVREAGRIVVCVDASAEVSTARTMSWSSGEPSTSVARVEKIASSSSNSAIRSSPANATTAIATERRSRRGSPSRAPPRGPGADAESSTSSVRLTALSQPQ